jgi:hypothetical protein
VCIAVAAVCVILTELSHCLMLYLYRYGHLVPLLRISTASENVWKVPEFSLKEMIRIVVSAIFNLSG